ncbi:MAG: hypothetical protein KHW89_07065, partial [Roseburia sp.]|nr:hypothetical protein [Roseburia sp.]
QKGKTSVLPSKNCFAILVGIPPRYEHFPIPEQSGLAHFARHRTIAYAIFLCAVIASSRSIFTL